VALEPRLNLTIADVNEQLERFMSEVVPLV
jgi:hypothetical protein